MSSENLVLVACGVALLATNAFLGAPIASKIAGFFTRVLPGKTQAASVVPSGAAGRDERPSMRSRG
jgi:hypothetical protein